MPLHSCMFLIAVWLVEVGGGSTPDLVGNWLQGDQLCMQDKSSTNSRWPIRIISKRTRNCFDFCIVISKSLTVILSSGQDKRYSDKYLFLPSNLANISNSQEDKVV